MLLSKKYAHLEALESKHAELDTAITASYSNYISDTEVTAMKIEKLRLKEEISHLQQEIAQYTDHKA